MRPGVMIYFDMRSAIDLLAPEEQGRLFLAIMDYAREGVLPEFEGQLEVLWELIRPRIDRDIEKYEETCQRRKAAAERRRGTLPEESTIAHN